MELVICGNAAGLRYLAAVIDGVITKTSGDPSAHVHLDDLHAPELVSRSVALNLRGAVKTWSAAGFAEYWHLVTIKGEHYLPTDVGEDLKFLTKYSEITSEKSATLRL